MVRPPIAGLRHGTSMELPSPATCQWSCSAVATRSISAPGVITRCSPPRIQFAEPRRRSRGDTRSEEHTSELQSRENLVCRLLLEKKKNIKHTDKASRSDDYTT